jgi:stage II sporulation SpoM-like protein
MSVDDLVLVQGMHDTRMALARWNRDPWVALAPWLGLSVAIALALLGVVWVIGFVSPADATRLYLPGLSGPATAQDYVYLLYRNSLVLALHALACVAGFMAGSSLPLSASKRSGLSRVVHEKAGPLAIAFVTCATLFSLSTQAYVLGGAVATLAPQLGLSPGLLLLGLMPHALPELIALFLPLAAWLIAARKDDWQDLLAATFVTVAIAVPVLLASAAVELWASPHLLRALT